MSKLLIDVGSTYFKVSTDASIEQHLRDFNKDILDDLKHKCGNTINSYEKEEGRLRERGRRRSGGGGPA